MHEIKLMSPFNFISRKTFSGGAVMMVAMVNEIYEWLYYKYFYCWARFQKIKILLYFKCNFGNFEEFEQKEKRKLNEVRRKMELQLKQLRDEKNRRPSGD